MKSIIQIKNECFICKINYNVITANNLTEYLIFNDYPKQNNKYELKIKLYYRHNNFNKYQEKFKNALEVSLKQHAQNKFEEKETKKEFIKQFNKSYL